MTFEIRPSLPRMLNMCIEIYLKVCKIEINMLAEANMSMVTDV